jgi:hypothetical protein
MEDKMNTLLIIGITCFVLAFVIITGLLATMDRKSRRVRKTKRVELDLLYLKNKRRDKK